MKAKRTLNKDYRDLRQKLFRRIILTFILTGIVGFLLYGLMFSMGLSEVVVRIFQRLFNIGREESLVMYQALIRDNMPTILLITLIVIVVVLIRTFLSWFTRYFIDVNRGIEDLVQERSEDISLPPELEATENKLNAVRRTLERRTREGREAEQRKNDLVVYLAHDLKTPLTSIIGYLSLLTEEQDISEAQRQKYLNITLDKSERLEDLINEFFDITRFNLSTITLDVSTVNLSHLMAQLIAEFEPILAEKGLRCALHAPQNLFVRCDVQKMQRVFDNLLQNAINYSYERTVIDITLRQDGEVNRIMVENMGPTIDADKLDRLFEQFFRLDSSRSTRSGGSGLGLAIARQIVEAHQGTITASSQDERIRMEVALPAS